MTVYEEVCRQLRETGDAVGVPVHNPNHNVDVEIMCALDLLLDCAYHDGSPRDLALMAEAWSQAGYHDGSIQVSHATQEAVLARVREARKGRHRNLLRARASGLLAGLRHLSEAGALDSRMTSEARRLRWLARGGHEA